MVEVKYRKYKMVLMKHWRCDIDKKISVEYMVDSLSSMDFDRCKDKHFTLATTPT